jgi:hypothetical protein
VKVNKKTKYPSNIGQYTGTSKNGKSVTASPMRKALIDNILHGRRCTLNCPAASAMKYTSKDMVKYATRAKGLNHTDSVTCCYNVATISCGKRSQFFRIVM